MISNRYSSSLASLSVHMCVQYTPTTTLLQSNTTAHLLLKIFVLLELKILVKRILSQNQNPFRYIQVVKSTLLKNVFMECLYSVSTFIEECIHGVLVFSLYLIYLILAEQLKRTTTVAQLWELRESSQAKTSREGISSSDPEN